MELDDFKSAWKSIPEEKTYNKQEIFEMLKKKSSSTVKWLLVFTLIEFSLVILFTTFSLIKGELITGEKIILENGKIANNYIIGSVATLIFTIMFIFFSFKTYQKINMNNSIKTLIEQIIAFRKVINLFILFIVMALIAVSIPYYFKLGINIYTSKVGQNFTLEQANTFGYLSVGVAIIFIIIITLLYYALLHWFFLRKLAQNLKDLKDIN